MTDTLADQRRGFSRPGTGPLKAPGLSWFRDHGLTSGSATVGPETDVHQGVPKLTTLRQAQPDVAQAERSGRAAAWSQRLEVPVGSITGMEKWNGRIVELAEGYFTADLKPATAGPRVFADFELPLLGPDADTAATGDVVYVTVRTVRTPAGLPHRTAAVRLRRMGQWSAEEVAAIEARATKMGEELAPYIE